MTNKLIFYFITLPAFFVLITFLPFPDIPTVTFNAIGAVFAAVWVANRFIPIDTLFTFAFYIAIIELCVVLLKHFSKIYFHNDDNNLTDDL